MAYGEILHELAQDFSVRIIRAPKPPAPDTIYDRSIGDEPTDATVNRPYVDRQQQSPPRLTQPI